MAIMARLIARNVTVMDSLKTARRMVFALIAKEIQRITIVKSKKSSFFSKILIILK
jgi:hypothetical protein